MSNGLVVIEGLEDFKATLAAVAEVTRGKAVTRALLDGGEIIRNEAKSRAPVLAAATPWRTRGALKSAIVSYASRWNRVLVRVRNKGNPKYWFLRMGRGFRQAAAPSNPWYWWHLEFGTRKMAARPFLRPAFEARKFLALAAIRRALAEPILTAARLRSRSRRPRLA